MTEHDDFEVRLASRLRGRAREIDHPFDSDAIVRATVLRADRETRWSDRPTVADRLRWPAGRPVIRIGMLLALIALLAAGLALAAGWLDRPAPELLRIRTTSLGSPGVAHMEVHLLPLPDGRVLLTGTWHRTTMLSAWNPATTRFETVGTLATPVRSPQAIALPDGRVLIIDDDVNSPPPTYQVLDPVAERSVVVDAPLPGKLLLEPMWLPDGRVLFSRGAAAQVFDPGTGTWSEAGPEADARRGPDGIRLPDGQVFVIGGISSLVWDPSTDTSITTGGTGMDWRPCGTVALADGRILAAGGEGGPDRVALWDPGSGVFQPAGRLEHDARVCDAALLKDGRVFIVSTPQGPQDTDQAQVLELLAATSDG